MIEIEVRDGRAGRVGGPAGIDGTGRGELLTTLQRDLPLDIGHRLTLEDGTEVEVIGAKESFETPAEASRIALVKQVVHVGTVM